VQALIFENSFGGEAIIYTDRSVIRHVQRSWAYMAQVKQSSTQIDMLFDISWAYMAQVGGKTVREDSGVFTKTTISTIMEVVEVIHRKHYT
jgi:hypothetical protein